MSDAQCDVRCSCRCSSGLRPPPTPNLNLPSVHPTQHARWTGGAHGAVRPVSCERSPDPPSRVCCSTESDIAIHVTSAAPRAPSKNSLLFSTCHALQMMHRTTPDRLCYHPGQPTAVAAADHLVFGGESPYRRWRLL